MVEICQAETRSSPTFHTFTLPIGTIRAARSYRVLVVVPRPWFLWFTAAASCDVICDVVCLWHEVGA
jgi:hypothetical protein